MQLTSLKLLLLLANAASLYVVVVLFVNHWRSGGDKKSWAMAFCMMAMPWLTLRGIFWLCTMISSGTWTSAEFYMLYWLPIPLQFANFMLVPLFYGQILLPRRQWNSFWKFARPIYITGTTMLATFMISWSLLAAIEEHKEYRCVTGQVEPNTEDAECYYMDISSNVFRALTAVCFIFLAVTVIINGCQLAHLDESHRHRFLIAGWTPQTLLVLDLTLFVVFLSRGVYQLSSVCGLWYLPDIPLEAGQDTCLLNVAAFVLWDYLPTVLLLANIARCASAGSTNSSLASLLPSTKHLPSKTLPDYGVFRAIHNAMGEEAPLPAEEAENFNPEAYPDIMDAMTSYGFYQHKPRAAGEQQSPTSQGRGLWAAKDALTKDQSDSDESDGDAMKIPHTQYPPEAHHHEHITPPRSPVGAGSRHGSITSAAGSSPAQDPALPPGLQAYAGALPPNSFVPPSHHTPPQGRTSLLRNEARMKPASTPP